MSRPIKFTKEDIKEFVKDFKTNLEALTNPDSDKITYCMNIDTKGKAKLDFSEEAWVKMQMLVQEYGTEIAWHGVAHRNGDAEYYISDILVYPQTVTGTKVDMDVDRYSEWLMDNCDDERFDHIYMQGHSHVNMGVTPSGTDLKHQEIILNQLSDDMFYIFLIWNKKGDKYIRIFDKAINTVFSTEDVEIEIFDGEYFLNEFADESQEMCRNRVIQTQQYTYADSLRKSDENYYCYYNYEDYEDEDYGEV